MKIFYVIAILCSLFAVVNGQPAQQYTFTLTTWANMGDVNIIFFNEESYSVGSDVIFSQLGSNLMTCNQQECTYTTGFNTVPSHYTYEYTFNGITFMEHIDTNINIDHPCLRQVNYYPETVVYRSLQNTNVDNLNQAPACSLGEVQCGEFIYDSELVLESNTHVCRYIPVSDISTLKTALAESSLFNGNCEMST